MKPVGIWKACVYATACTICHICTDISQNIINILVTAKQVTQQTATNCESLTDKIIFVFNFRGNFFPLLS